MGEAVITFQVEQVTSPAERSAVSIVEEVVVVVVVALGFSPSAFFPFSGFLSVCPWAGMSATGSALLPASVAEVTTPIPRRADAFGRLESSELQSCALLSAPFRAGFYPC
ncbi:hypothetical protein EYF80_005757 [Liparis tanakae]|uniref:Uncharacterized protein n=1 Tax=Liparis tanakae TaxID=230148 RepID=A0A4Z2J148_9TELE|nr:hypothetical protein EYF80_005757 [Liparis tanakae]